jgi:hypothetical protein
MTAPQPVPINALFGMDFVTLLVVVMSTDTMAQVSEKVAANVVGKRIARRADGRGGGDRPHAVRAGRLRRGVRQGGYRERRRWSRAAHV